ncbi:unnamed protein product [Gongylonema pulchrum]|uniref:MADF domain-containing protein n=1 Tax=Gongylonema pulchrum TaxID=637853 RepID=A0A183DAD7_9BILA|nr:unnamed protein product [Gongylonema pulchrum]
MDEQEPCSFNLRLIEAVRNSRCLYDAKDRLYRSSDHKTRVWNRIVQTLQFDGEFFHVRITACLVLFFIERFSQNFIKVFCLY